MSKSNIGYLTSNSNFSFVLFYLFIYFLTSQCFDKNSYLMGHPVKGIV